MILPPVHLQGRMSHSWRRIFHILCWSSLVLLLGACGGSPPGQAPARPTRDPGQHQPTVLPRPTPASPAVPALVVPPSVSAQIVLTLKRGTGAGQIGHAATFRIGADGTIRVLDSANRRLLVFTSAGDYDHRLDLAEAHRPLDFCSDSAGNLYVLDSRGDAGDQAGPVLHYAADGTLKGRIPVGDAVVPTGIMLTAQGDLMLVNGDQYWAIQRNGLPTPAEDQAQTQLKGFITPRSPVAFNTSMDDENTLTIGIQSVLDMQPISSVLTAPGATTFFNIDRAMNVYVTNPLTRAPEQGIQVWRYAPDGTLLGSATIAVPNCDFGMAADRRFYIDQAGAAWTLCRTPDTTTVTRAVLVDQDGRPLPEAAQEPADVPWKPAPGTNPSE